MTFPKTRNWRFNARYGALALLAMSLSACSLEERKTARVVIDLSELRSERVAASRWAASSLNATAMSTPAQPTWGSGSRALTTPLTSYDQLDCVMLNVMGEGITSSFTGKPAILPEKWDLTNVCSYVYPGTYSTPVSLDHASIELFLSVQKGPSRLIQVLGFNNATTLRCEDITLPMIVDNDGVDIFELGKTKVDLMSDATVEIQGKVATAKNVKDCGKSEMTVPFGSQRIRIPTKCKAPYADVYLRKKFDDGTLGEQRKTNATARVACNIGQGPYIEVDPLSTSALTAQSGELAVVQSDALALDIRWFADTTTSTEAALATLFSARYDVTAPTVDSATLELINSTFIANLTNLSEAGRASIRKGSCTTGEFVSAEIDIFAGSSQVGLQANQDLAIGTVYHLMVRDFVGHEYCPASLTYTDGDGQNGDPGFNYVVIPPFINASNVQTTNASSWQVTGGCNSSQVDQVELLNESYASIFVTGCVNGSFTMSPSGVALAGPSGLKVFRLIGKKGAVQVGGAVNRPVTRDVNPPTPPLTLTNLTESTGSTTGPLFSVTYPALAERVIFDLYRDSCAGTPQETSPWHEANEPDGSQSMTGSVSPTAGPYYFYVRARDEAGNVSACIGPTTYTYSANANAGGSGYLFIGGRVAGAPTHRVDKFETAAGGFLAAPGLDPASYRASGEASVGVTEVAGAIITGGLSQSGYALAVGGRNWISAGTAGGDIDVWAYLTPSASTWSYFTFPVLSGESVDRRRGAAVVSSGNAAWVIGGSSQTSSPIYKISETTSGQLNSASAGILNVAAHGLQGAFIEDGTIQRVLAVGGCHSGYEGAGGDCTAPQTGVVVIDPKVASPYLGVVAATSSDTNRRGASLTPMPDGSAVYFGGIDGGNALRTDFVVIRPSTIAGSTGISKNLISLSTTCRGAAQRYQHVAVSLGGTQLAILGGKSAPGTLLTDGYVVDTANGNCVPLGSLTTSSPARSLSALGPGMMGGSAWKVGSATEPGLFIQSGNGSDAMWKINFAITDGYVSGLATGGVSYDNRMQTNATPQGPGARDSYLLLQY